MAWNKLRKGASVTAPMERREETGERGTRGRQAVWAERMEAATANNDLPLGFHLNPTGLWRAKR